MKKPAYFSSPADYDTRRPYCVVLETGPEVAYDILTRWATRKAAEAACERSFARAMVMTITQVNRANARACADNAARLLSYGNN